MTIADLAGEIGVTPSAMGLYERGLRPLGLDRLREIATALGVQAADLLSRQDNPYAMTADERRLLDQYRALPAPGRSTIAQVAENLQTWHGQPSGNEDEAVRAADAGGRVAAG